jgi:hypothetical protein
MFGTRNKLLTLFGAGLSVVLSLSEHVDILVALSVKVNFRFGLFRGVNALDSLQSTL